MTTYLLDANVLIALVAHEHVHHERATRWAQTIEHFALCPIVEGALIRFSLRLGIRADDAVRSLRLVRERRGYEFWPDSLSYIEADLARLHGHRQVTDAYLASLARSRPDALLATMDEGLAAAHRDSTLLIPG